LDEVDLTKLHCWHQTAYIFYEVSIGDKVIFGENSTDRRIDIVIIPHGHREFRYTYSDKKDLFKKLVRDDEHQIEIIEVKTNLNRGVIGQILVAEYMFKKKIKVVNLKKSILYQYGDDALEMYCRAHQISLIKY
jgi:hypothetical protein